MDIDLIQSFPKGKMVLGYSGKLISHRFIDVCRDVQAYGIILFSRNFENISNLKDTCKFLNRKLQNIDIMIDQEGGEKSRISGSLYNFPSQKELSRMPLNEVYKIIYERSVNLKALGITTNLSPVCDLSTSIYISNRSFGSNPETVSNYCEVMLSAYHDAGLKCCAKHFPGIGSSQNDPHEDLIVSTGLREEFYEKHFVPFERLILKNCDYVMTTHLLAKAFDKKNCATYSKKIIDELRSLGFKGKIITDDLAEMRGAFAYDDNERISRALDAGHDLALWCSL